MNYFSRLSLAGLLLTNSIGFAAVTPLPGWYAGLMGGGGWTQPVKFTVAPNLLLTGTYPYYISPTSIDLSYKGFGNGGGQIGYRCNKFRFEAEALYTFSGYKKLQVQNATFGTYTVPSFSNSYYFHLNGETTMVSGLVNVYYDFFTPDGDVTWMPYVGAGIGLSYIENNIKFYFNNQQVFPAPNSDFGKENGSTSIAQAILGISYLLDDYTTVGTDIRLMRTGNVTLIPKGRFGIANEVEEHMTLFAWNINFNFTFDQPST
ncbi:Surface antigen [Legionella birminghamensis]|uniref:Surface antigen n=1 Tax=Legionella birminghamensis TaxID=28083 RepID=A0A378I860_9GAMM|nr:P44/Msp2 family outer membrane protein [Legionella birminghamensis]KTC68057.1 Surface antigen [Legionella birminghamensis]STX31233.1 Surface antigen [Legionella birminghamensis]